MAAAPLAYASSSSAGFAWSAFFHASFWKRNQRLRVTYRPQQETQTAQHGRKPQARHGAAARRGGLRRSAVSELIVVLWGLKGEGLSLSHSTGSTGHRSTQCLIDPEGKAIGSDCWTCSFFLLRAGASAIFESTLVFPAALKPSASARMSARKTRHSIRVRTYIDHWHAPAAAADNAADRSSSAAASASAAAGLLPLACPSRCGPTNHGMFSMQRTRERSLPSVQEGKAGQGYYGGK